MKDSLLLFGFTWKGTLLQVKLSETCVPGVWHVWNKLLCFNLTSFFAVAEQHIHFLFIPAATRKRRLCLLQLHESWFSCCLAWCVCKALQSYSKDSSLLFAAGWSLILLALPLVCLLRLAKAANLEIDVDVPDNFATKTHKSTTRKR